MLCCHWPSIRSEAPMSSGTAAFPSMTALTPVGRFSEDDAMVNGPVPSGRRVSATGSEPGREGGAAAAHSATAVHEPLVAEPLVHAEQVHHEDQRLTGLDHAARAAVAVA